MAKFHGDRSRDLREHVVKKNITGKTEDLPLLCTGGLIKIQKNRDLLKIADLSVGHIHKKFSKIFPFVYMPAFNVGLEISIGTCYLVVQHLHLSP